MERRTATAGLLAALLVLSGCAPPDSPAPAGTSPAPTAPSADSPSANSSAPDALGEVQVITRDLQAPWSIAFAGDAALVSERDSGRILEVLDSGATREVARLAEVSPGGEGGLLGLAVDGDELFAYLTAADGNRIVRYPLAGEPGALRLGEGRVLLRGLPSAANHNGGRLALGPDGMLYATVGDAGTPDAAQETGSLAGKILRLRTDGTVPADNPFPGSPVYSYGHRNVQGLGWGPDGTLYASEFGQNTFDELNRIEPGGNYGWPLAEGIAGRAGLIDPLQQWAPAEASPSGLAVAGGSIFLANLRGQRLREVPLADTARSLDHFTGRFGRLRDVVRAPDGSLWLLGNNTDGRGNPGPGDDQLLRVAPPR